MGFWDAFVFGAGFAVGASLVSVVGFVVVIIAKLVYEMIFC